MPNKPKVRFVAALNNDREPLPGGTCVLGCAPQQDQFLLQTRVPHIDPWISHWTPVQLGGDAQPADTTKAVATDPIRAYQANADGMAFLQGCGGPMAQYHLRTVIPQHGPHSHLMDRCAFHSM